MPRVQIAPLMAYSGGMSFPHWEGNARAELEATFPSLPEYVGLHMGAPHWLGTGMARDGQRIVRMTPYVRLDFVPEQGVMLAALAEPAPFDAWLRTLRAATGWP